MNHDEHDHEQELDPECQACTEGIDAYMAKIEETIKSCGHAIVGTQTEGPIGGSLIPMAYTVGLNDVDLPEIIVFGLNMQSAHILLNQAAEMLKEGKLPIDEPVEELANLPCVFKHALPGICEAYLGVASNRRPGRVKALHMVLPDKEGRFPWNEDCDIKMLVIQPPIWLSKEEYSALESGDLGSLLTGMTRN